MTQPDSNDHSQRLREERNNWQNVQEQAIRELVDSNQVTSAPAVIVVLRAWIIQS
ncbi:hypothetical protein ROZALSC1DRAFT_31890 [Rozella allomycis CSF55]|uniref:Uncharacterized protein n=1 Tax=Rozella allomycis (strain CSF55) TaxID=988480 RepID=A0A4V1IYW4_ROZAC|nr:hypothetical protein ROZALSC1DRAFT_31890 [Rozella allomycis CSF55]